MTAQLNIANCCALLEFVSDAVVIFNDDRQVVFANESFHQLGAEIQEQIITADCWYGQVELSLELLTEHGLNLQKVKKVRLLDGVAVILSDNHQSTSYARDTLRQISRTLENTDNVYIAAAQAIRQCLGWRWVAITRFIDICNLEVLAVCDGDTELDTYQYEIAGTPCELVVESNRFTLFSDLLKAFPEYQALHEMGAVTYAGLIYRGSDNKPLGHVMAMHDQRDVDFSMAEDVLNSVTLALSSHFQLHHVQAQLAEVQCIANEDALTGVGNRYAFEAMLEDIRHQSEQQNYAVAMVDLDLLKYLNDHVGHQMGDRFIQMMAQELTKVARQSDHVFRIGGDEFAIVLQQSSRGFLLSLYERFKKAVNRVREVLRFPVDASIGFASMREVDFDIENWIALADQRMYQDKNAKRKSSEIAS